MALTTDPQDPRLGKGADDKPVPQNEVYLILSDEERAKGFVRPFRNSYIHTGKQIKGTPELLTGKAKEDYGDHFVAFAKNPDYPHKDSYTGIYLTQKEWDTFKDGFAGGCGALTRMAKEISETYARDPKFYGATYCMGCKMHLPVEEFTWDGTNEKVGS